MVLLESIVRCVVASVLLISGVKHMLQPYLFAHTIAGYQLIPAPLVLVAAVALSCLHVALGSMLITNRATKLSLVVSGLLFGMFVVAQLSAIYRGLAIDCGCFGYSQRTINEWSVATPIALLACSLLSLVLGIWTNRSQQPIEASEHSLASHGV